MRSREAKEIEDAKLFLNFVHKVKDEEILPSDDVRTSDGITYIFNENSPKKFVCAYCGQSYTYQKGLFSHMDRLHNIKKSK